MFGNVIHDWDDERKLLLIKKAYEALPVGGYIIVYDFLIDDEEKVKTSSIVMSLCMQITWEGGS